MKTTHKNDKIVYKYILDKGISKVHGGINVMSQLDYPDEIINDTI